VLYWQCFPVLTPQRFPVPGMPRQHENGTITERRC